MIIIVQFNLTLNLYSKAENVAFIELLSYVGMSCIMIASFILKMMIAIIFHNFILFLKLQLRLILIRIFFLILIF